MAAMRSLPTEILAHIIELSSPSTLAAASLVSRQWNSAAQTVLATLAIKVYLKLLFLGPEHSTNQSSQRVNASPSWVLGVENSPILPEFGGETLSTLPPRVLLVVMASEVTIDCRQLSALSLFDPTEVASSLADRIRAALPDRIPSGLNICFSVATFQFMNNDSGNDIIFSSDALPKNIAALETALDLCRNLCIPHIQLDRISYILLYVSTPPRRGALLPSVAQVSLVGSDNQWDINSKWNDREMAHAISAFTSQRLSFPNAKQLTAPHIEVQISPANHFLFLRSYLDTNAILDPLTPSVRQKTTTFISADNNQVQFPVNSLLPNLEVFGTIPLALGLWKYSDPHRTLLSSLPATVHTLHATLHIMHLFYAAAFSLSDLFTQFSTLLPPGTQRLVLTVRTAAGPPQEDVRLTGRKLWLAMVEIAKRVTTEVRIERAGDWVEEARLHVCWKEQLDELVAAGVIKYGTVMLDRSKHDCHLAWLPGSRSSLSYSYSTQILARVIELSSPRSLAAASLVARRWNSAAQTVVPNLALKVHLRLQFLEPESRKSVTSQYANASPSLFLGVGSTRILAEFERTTLPDPALLVAMSAEVNINARALAALGPLDSSETVCSLKDKIRAAINVSVVIGMNILISVATFQFMKSMGKRGRALFTAPSTLSTVFTRFSKLLPPATRRLIVTVRTTAGPPVEDMRPADRKLWCVMVEIAKRVEVEVRIERAGN
ncbi:hypothetical protein M427DRAFT_35795 [Gonapodya prolifera JEL478]|uniref:F-box domain-containing protein n=1 Tax=Gonapodya prolifera (strain JEL478) TaxID=1344416 RepID=A0A139A3N9_GONPJ|nr:hypothetical protein M427DRAFT_35795 [Gonapodya prolifera JEL478]|eukprot:KXS11412.1 hypothetical protein M427DRAFT_35795 [Gonapodya prolifera JEL478]